MLVIHTSIAGAVFMWSIFAVLANTWALPLTFCLGVIISKLLSTAISFDVDKQEKNFLIDGMITINGNNMIASLYCRYTVSFLMLSSLVFGMLMLDAVMNISGWNGVILGGFCIALIIAHAVYLDLKKKKRDFEAQLKLDEFHANIKPTPPENFNS